MSANRSKHDTGIAGACHVCPPLLTLTPAPGCCREPRASTGKVTSTLFLNIPYGMLFRAALSTSIAARVPQGHCASSGLFFSLADILSSITIDADMSLSSDAVIFTLGFCPITAPQLSSDAWPSSEYAYYMCSCQRIASNACPMACPNGRHGSSGLLLTPPSLRVSRHRADQIRARLFPN